MALIASHRERWTCTLSFSAWLKWGFAVLQGPCDWSDDDSMWPVFCYQEMANHTTHSQRHLCWVLGRGTVACCLSWDRFSVTIIPPVKQIRPLVVDLLINSTALSCPSCLLIRRFATACKYKRIFIFLFRSFTGRWDEENWAAANSYDGQRQEGWGSTRPSKTHACSFLWSSQYPTFWLSKNKTEACGPLKYYLLHQEGNKQHALASIILSVCLLLAK